MPAQPVGDYGSNDNSNDLSNEVYGRLEMPRINPDKSDNLVIAHRAVMDYSKNKTDINYCVEWNIYLKSPRWVCYVMNGTNRETNTSRYYQTIDISGDTLTMKAYDVSGHTLCDSLQILKPTTGQSIVRAMSLAK